MKIETFALHHLSTQNEQIVVDPASFDPHFDSLAYSNFKHGDGKATQNYGEALAELVQACGATSSGEQLFISGSAYEFVPTAAAHLAASLSQALRRQGVRTTYFHTGNKAVSAKGDVPTGDFSSMTAEQRAAVLAVNRPCLDTETQTMIDGGKVITVDDIRMTGAHERTLLELFEATGVETSLFCYIAVFDAVQGAKSSQVEAKINQKHVHDLSDLSQIANQKPFLPNARVSRFVLGASSEDCLLYTSPSPRDS